MSYTIDAMSRQVMGIIRKYQTQPPVDVLAIAHEFEIKVYKIQDWPDSLSGQIIKDCEFGGESGYAIFVNAMDRLARQRFTIAHELAHFILHMADIGDGIIDDALYRSGLSNKKEIEANNLAADILMPWHLINALMDQGKKTIPELAGSFNVSESAMSIRLGIPC